MRRITDRQYTWLVCQIVHTVTVGTFKDLIILLQDVVSVVDDAFTLFYGKFRTNAPRVKALMEQIEQRVDKSPE